MTCWAIIPVKDPAFGKSRLAGVLDPGARARLARSMASHVIAAAGQAANVARCCVVGTPPGDLPHGVDLVAEPGGGLNPAVSAAVAHAARHGATRVVVIAGDLPHVSASDIQLLAAAPDNEIAFAPDRHGTGTNALSLPLPSAQDFTFAFGRDSFARHRQEAERLGHAIGMVHSSGLACDIDEPPDLADLGDVAGTAR